MSPMAMKTTSATIDLSTKSIVVFTLTAKNQYKPSYQPRVNSVEIVSVGTGVARRFAVRPIEFDRLSSSSSLRESRSLMGEAAKSGSIGSTDKIYQHMISVDVEPGAYTLRDVVGLAAANLIAARFEFPVDAKFTVPPRSVTYVGHVDMVNRERKGDEPPSGSRFPLIDQAVAGFAGGTMDVTVSDKSEVDIPLFIKTYPCLKDIQIGKAIMRK